MHLRAGDVDPASAVLAGLNGLDYPPRRSGIQLVHGLTDLLRGDAEGARAAFSASIDLADERLTLAEHEVASWEVKGLALAGLAVLGDEASVTKSLDAFSTARTIATAPGLAARVLALLDLLTPFDAANRLDSLRGAAAGR